MKSQAMKLCTVICGESGLSGMFILSAAGDARLFQEMYFTDMRIAVESTARRFGYTHHSLVWSKVRGYHPLRLQVACPDELAHRMRMALVDQFIVELDHP